MENNILRIGHTADVQVKNREQNLYRSTLYTLQNIERIIKNEKLPIFVISGDLVEYPSPNESERRLIYTHLSRILSIPTLQELVIITGNHDLEKDYKVTDLSEGNNPILSYYELIHSLDKKFADKLQYFKSSGVYFSKVSDRIKYLCYSIEDNIMDFPVENDGKLPICLYHGMLKEYADSESLNKRMRKDLYNKLITLNQFQPDSLILSGDIHKRLKFVGINGQIFYYPGSTHQHTHSEGSYIVLNEDIKFQPAEKKAISVYSIPLSEDSDSFPNNVVHEEIELECFLSNITISLNHKLPIATTIAHLSSLSLPFGSEQTYIKVKSVTSLVQNESELNQIIQQKVVQSGSKRVNISFEYDKIINPSISNDNTIINEILEEKKSELIQNNSEFAEETSETINLTCDNIDDLLLSSDQIQKLFASVLENHLKKFSDADFTNSDLAEEIKILFGKQLNMINSDVKRFNIALKNIKTTGFQLLGENSINLDIPGITHILASNGVGKTTMYNMFRWVTRGEVYDDMSKTTLVKNNLHVFNIANIHNDTVSVELDFTVNNTPIKATRTVNRVWKNNVSDELKRSLSWQDYVSTVTREIKIEITKQDSTIQTITGEQAENTLTLWFGDIVKHIAIINEFKIDKILFTAPNLLNEMILDFIGVDYIKKLSDDKALNEVKSELMNVPKPTRTKESLNQDITNCAQEILSATNQNTELENNQERLNKSIEVLKSSIELNNQAKVDLGNIPNLIETKTIEIKDIELVITNFEELPILQKTPFDKVKPHLDDSQVFKYEQENISNQKIITDTQKVIDTATIDKDMFVDKILDIAENHENDSFNNEIQLLKAIDVENSAITTHYNTLAVFFKGTLMQLEEKMTSTIMKITELKSIIATNKKEVEVVNESILSGICEKCGRPFDEFEEKKEQLLNDKLALDELIKTDEELLTKKETYLESVKLFITTYQNYVELSNKSDYLLFSLEALSKIEAITQIKTLIDACLDESNRLKQLKESSEKNKSLLKDEVNKIKNVDFDFVLFSEFIKENKFDSLSELSDSNSDNRLTLFNYVDKIITTMKLINSHADIIETYNLHIKETDDAIKLLKENYQTAFETYNTDLEEYNKKNETIDSDNEKAKTHNNSKTLKENDLTRLKLELENYTLKLPAYNLLVEKSTQLSEESDKDQKELDEATKTINTNNISINTLTLRKENVQKEYDNCLTYQKNKIIWDIYSKLIKTQFKEVIFEYYQTFLNNTLNELLEDVAFKLFWNKDSELYMIKMKGGHLMYQPVQQASGMEKCFLGLSLIYTIHLLAVKHSISHIFIDEISGRLNDGKKLSYEAQDYQNMLVLILSKFTNKSIFIVDHHIDNLFETATYEVRKTDEGSKWELMS